MPRNARPHARIRFAAVFALVLAASFGARATYAGPAGTWERISPPPQSGGASAYDSARRLMYVFGGDGTSILHATSVDGPPSEWTNVKTTGTPPAPRSGLSLSYDPSNDRLIVFGGIDGGNRSSNELWQLSLAGTPTWSKITTAGTPPDPRSYFGAAFDDARQVLLVFGGQDSTGAPAENRIFQIDMSLPTPTWTPIAPLGETPSARYSLSLCDDTAHDRVVLHGGFDGSTNYDDLYTMDFASHTWSLVPATGDVPPASSGGFFAYDADDDLVMMWGGSGSDNEVRTLAAGSGLWTIRPNSSWQSGPTGHAHSLGVWVPGDARFLLLDENDYTNVFEFHYAPPSGSYWQNWRDPGALGEPNAYCSFVYDRADRIAFLSGGTDVTGQPLQSTWSYSLGGPNGWTELWYWSTTANPTPPLQQHTAVWDQAHRRMLIFGGETSSYARSNAVYAMDVDSYLPFNKWSAIAPAGTPPSARYGSAGIYDPVGDRMIVFGGSDVSGYPRGDLWQLALSTTPTWSPIVVPGGPAARSGHTAIYDERKRRMIVFGGTDSLSGADDADVWALDLPALTWTHLLPTGTPAPGRFQHTAVYDSRRERMIVYGGKVDFGANMSDTWELDLAPATPVWRKLATGVTAVGAPLQRFAHAALYDSTGDRMLVFGGLLPPFTIFGNDYPLKDLWSLQFDFSGVTAVGPSSRTAEFAVGPPAPNPARGTTRLSYTLPHAAHVRAAIYDLAGRRILELENGVREAGPHDLAWTGDDGTGHPVVAGLYFCRIDSEGHTGTRKLMRIR